MTNAEIITCDANNLIEAAQKIRKNSPNKSETKQFALHELDEVNKAQEELHNRKWTITQKKPFILHERGHIRKVQGNIPYDRMIIHSYIDNVLTPLLQPYIIYDNYASQKNKGTDLARNRFRKFIHQAYREYGNNEFYILLMDFSKFYDNIRHDFLKQLIMKYIPNDDKEFNEYMIDVILDSFKVDVSWMTDYEYSNCLSEKYVSLDHLYEKQLGEKYMRKSLNIGNQASQLFSIFYPTPIDNYFKIVKGCHYYGRYMDDIECISNDKNFLKKCLSEATCIANKLGLFINQKKTQIVKVKHNFKFLNRIYRLTDTGHLEEHLCRDSISREARKLKKLQNLFLEGAKTYKECHYQYRSWIINYAKYMTTKQLNYLNSLYDKLFVNDWRDGVAN